MTPRTLFDKVWDAHLVTPQTAEAPGVLYVDLHLVHEVTSPQAFAELAARGLPVRRPDRTLATMDHAIPTARSAAGARLPIAEPQAARQVAALAASCSEHGIALRGVGDAQQGIVHVIGPELGATRPGMTVVCGDSHTSTHGAFGAVAFGIGTSEVAQVLATQCLLAERPRTLAVEIDGVLAHGVTAKDLALGLIARFGVGGATGHAVEYRGETVRNLSMEERMTLCNLSIEWGARVGLVAPDATTEAYLAGRPLAPTGGAWEAACAAWRVLPSDPGAAFDRRLAFDASSLAPMVTWGTNPGMGVAVDGTIPDPGDDPAAVRALTYMGLSAGEPIAGQAIDVVFVGSCTNARLSDLRAAAGVLAGRRVAAGVRMLVVPGSQGVKQAAEAEGLAQIFVDAGAEWHDAGCSLCLAMNGDRLAPGQRAVSTSNRNFEGRQGPGGRTLLASPLTAAASAVAGRVADPRELLR